MNRIMDYAVYFLVGFGLILLLHYFFIKYVHFRPKKKSTLSKAIRSKACGIIFGIDQQSTNKMVLYSSVKQEGHIIALGGTGTGKTDAVLKPSIRSIVMSKSDARIFLIDISGDILNDIDSDIENKLVFEPLNEDTIPFNVFWYIDTLDDPKLIDKELRKLSLMLKPDRPELDGAAAYYYKAGQDILTATLLARFYDTDDDFIDMCDLVSDNGYQQLFSIIDASGNEKAQKLISQFEGGVPENISGCMQQAKEAVKLFATDAFMRNAFRRPKDGEQSIDPSKLEDYHTFIVLPDDELEEYADAMHLLTAQYLQYFSVRPLALKNRKIIAAIDEFSSFGRLDILGALRKARKHGVRMFVLSQAVEDLDLNYSDTERAAMMNNFSFKVLLGASDPNTQRYFAELIGYKRVKRTSTTRSATQSSQTDSEEREWIIEPAELDHLGDELILLHPDGYCRLKKNSYHKYYKKNV